MSAEDYHDMSGLFSEHQFPGTPIALSTDDYGRASHVRSRVGFIHECMKEAEKNMAKRIAKRIKTRAKDGVRRKKTATVKIEMSPEFRNRINQMQRDLELQVENIAQRAQEELDRLREQVEEPFVWRTADGVDMVPQEMDEEHLRNCVSYTQRRLVKKIGESTWLSDSMHFARAYYEFLKECERRGIRV
jgi:hypothetical protein